MARSPANQAQRIPLRHCRRVLLAGVLVAVLGVMGAAGGSGPAAPSRALAADRSHATVLHATPPGAAAAASGLTMNPPIGSPPYPANPAIPYKNLNQSSVWGTDRVEIKLTVNRDGRPMTVQPWYAQGVDYEPTPIGGSAGFLPANDFFFDNDPHTWAGLLARDIPLMRELGINTLRTYGWWKWEPFFFNGDSMFPHWPALDWSTGDSEPFEEPGKEGVFSYPHNTHDPFLDLCWNNGVNPIYVWIGLSLDKVALFDNNDPNAQQFIKYTAQWAAKKYGNHPAVIGFIIGNELNDAKVIRRSDFWGFLNDVGALVKASAPNKLTMSAFTDANDVWNTPISGGAFNGKTSPEVYNLDVWGRNPYNNPSLPGTDLPSYRTQIYDHSVIKMQPSMVKPLLYTEFGTPASTHQFVMGEPYLACFPNVIFPMPQMCPTAPNASPPGSSSGAPVQLGTMSRTGNRYGLPAPLQTDFPNIQRGTPLPAADTADWILGFWAVFNATKASNMALGMAGNLKFASGGYLFEWLDEWWKAGVPPEHNANQNSANNVFAGGWDDEEWFGMFGVQLNGRTCVVGNCPLVNPDNGRLIGSPDTLLPRATVCAVYQAYAGMSTACQTSAPMAPPPPLPRP